MSSSSKATREVACRGILRLLTRWAGSAARAVLRGTRGEGGVVMARGEIAQIFRVGKSRPAGGKRAASKRNLNRVEQMPEPSAPVLGRATEGDSGSHPGASAPSFGTSRVVERQTLGT